MSFAFRPDPEHYEQEQHATEPRRTAQSQNCPYDNVHRMIALQNAAYLTSGQVFRRSISDQERLTMGTLLFISKDSGDATSLAI